jgi:hypothetical protein
MPTLILKQNGIRSGGLLNGPLYIGRRPANSLVILDPAVSRLHAWIGRKEDRYFIADADSRTGTFVNEQRISERHPLQEGDCINIGPVELSFHTSDTLPPSVLPIHFNPPADADPGVFFECRCGRLMWASTNLGGRPALCAACGHKIKIPGGPADCSSPIVAAKVPQPRPVATRRQPVDCGVCHSPIGAGEPTTTCPECDSTFHRSCWDENHGCSTYGCGQVDAIATLEDRAASESNLPPGADEPVSRPFPWDFLLLGAAAVSIPAGALAFGVPGLLIAAAAATRLKRANRRGVVWAALTLGVAAVILGVVASLFWWYPAEL